MSKGHAFARLHLDPTACDGHGFCAEVLPELIGLDEWEYPLMHSGGLATDVPEHLVKEAKRAIAACPVNALRMQRKD